VQIPATYDELVAEARERQVREAADRPTPKTINVPAVLTLGQPRTLALGGVGLRAPPLSYLNGVRVLVVAHALHAQRRAGATDPATVGLALSLVRNHLHPTARIGWRVRAQLRRTLRQDPEFLEHLTWWLVAVPDEADVVTSASVPTLDLMDQLADFVRHYPKWVGPDGWPLTWDRFVHGSRCLSRARVREDLRHATAVRVAGADQKDYKQFDAEWREAAGWSHRG
jgi:hypothetical protein